MIEFKNILDSLVERGATMTFLQWYSHTTLSEMWAFYEKTITHHPYYLAICLKDKENSCPIGYVKAEMNDSHDFGTSTGVSSV